MKILPDYLIEYMPDLEEAIEELRLSVLDHAYDLLKCLDIDELTSDDIRHKLELYDIKVENMSSAWLPNNRFYRMYPEIKHNRTRYNAIKSIAKSGGQFEGVWSTGFSSKSEYNFRTIQILRHYSLGSALDGYFYVSGNTSLKNGIISSNALQALQTDILINQALPAGYTYLYISWPRPSYPGDASCYYNVHMLDYDRLAYCTDSDCKDYTHTADKYPASMNYNWNCDTESDLPNSPFRASYWFDYHYIDPYHKNDEGNIDQWPMKESSVYKTLDTATNDLIDIDDIKSYYNSSTTLEGTKYELDESCAALNSMDNFYPTKCYRYSKDITTYPNRSQIFTPKELPDRSNNINNDPNITTASYTIDENYVSGSSPESISAGAYRYDYLDKQGIVYRRELLNHFKEFRPVWNENQLFKEMVKSDYGSEINPGEPKPNSLYNWFNLKNQKSCPFIDQYSSTAIYNDPAVSEVSHTNYDRPTLSKYDSLSCCYLDNQNIVNSNTALSDNISENALYCLDSEWSKRIIDPTHKFVISAVGYYDDHGNIILRERINYPTDTKLRIAVDPSNSNIFVDRNEDNLSSISYVLYRESPLTRLWLSPDKLDVQLGNWYLTLYDEFGSDKVYQFFETNTNSLSFTITGVFTASGAQVACPDAEIKLWFDGERFFVALDNSPIGFEAAYVDFASNTVNKPAIERIPKEVPHYVYDALNGVSDLTAKYIEVDNFISVNGDKYISMDQFHERYILQKYYVKMYEGDEPVYTWLDDNGSPLDPLKPYTTISVTKNDSFGVVDANFIYDELNIVYINHSDYDAYITIDQFYKDGFIRCKKESIMYIGEVPITVYSDDKIESMDVEPNSGESLSTLIKSSVSWKFI